LSRGAALSNKSNGWPRRTAGALYLRTDGAAAAAWLEALGADALVEYGLVIIDRRAKQPDGRRYGRRASSSQAIGAR
jgi:hypothetical protein